jgi:hypothetical protein
MKSSDIMRKQIIPKITEMRVYEGRDEIPWNGHRSQKSTHGPSEGSSSSRVADPKE